MVHATVFDTGLVVLYVELPTAGHVVGLAVNVSTPIAAVVVIVTLFVTFRLVRA